MLSLSSSLPCHPIGLYSDPRAVIAQAALDGLFLFQLVHDSTFIGWSGKDRLHLLKSKADGHASFPE